MRRATVCIALFLLPACVAAAEPFRERLNAANDQLRRGNVQEAIAAYRDLQVEQPESPELFMNMGCARYMLVQQEEMLPADDGEKPPFEEARASFERAAATGSGAVRRDAAFNAANCLAQMAKRVPGEAGQDAVLLAYDEAIKAYENVLRQYPDYAEARQNLDHMRYLLKKMLQNPPEPQPQEGKGESQPQESQDEEQESNPEQQKGRQERQEDRRDQSSNDQEDSQEQETEPRQPQNADQNEEEREKREQQMAAAREEQQPPELDPEQEQAAPDVDKPDDRQTIEALLQSLADRDQIEQRLERRGPRDTHLRGDWW